VDYERKPPADAGDCRCVWKPPPPVIAKAEDALTENLNAFVALTRKRVGDPHLAADRVQDSG
jgi:hypothetical protein